MALLIITELMQQTLLELVTVQTIRLQQQQLTILAM